MSIPAMLDSIARYPSINALFVTPLAVVKWTLIDVLLPLQTVILTVVDGVQESLLSS
jgi:hypothetical protein